MTNLEIEIKDLKERVLEMLRLVLAQTNKAGEAFRSLDVGLAEEIIHQEKRVNAYELTIDKKCENIFALFNPVATDLRFVISMLKMNSDIERIGDYTASIAKYVIDIKGKLKPEKLHYEELNKMFDVAYNMVDIVIISFETENTELVRQVFLKDKILNDYNENASSMIERFVQENPTQIREALYLFSTIKKIERLGDHIKNIAEDWVFYLEGNIIKHKDIKGDV